MTNLRLERGPADFDIRHQFVTALVWQLNYYSGESSLKRAFLNGWRSPRSSRFTAAFRSRFSTGRTPTSVAIVRRNVRNSYPGSTPSWAIVTSRNGSIPLRFPESNRYRHGR